MCRLSYPWAVIPFFVVLTACGFVSGAIPDGSPTACLSPGRWAVPAPAGAIPRAGDQVLASLARQQAVLLGETHDDVEHHRWQLSTIAGLYALRPRMVLGFEMFPRRVQPVLDEWVSGRLADAEFLTRVEWQRVWGYDVDLYLPIFQFARLHRIPMLALNVESELVHEVREKGWLAIPAREREGVTDPAPAEHEYLITLYQSYLSHEASGDRPRPPQAEPSATELAAPAFRHFVEAMQLWDRAMGQGIAERLHGANSDLVVAIMGTGHLEHGRGVPRQLRDLGINRIAVALPWSTSDACALPAPGVADVVFGLGSRPSPAEIERPRLGISVEPAPSGVLVRAVRAGSIAEQAGLRTDDVIVRIAGEAATQPADIIGAVQRQAPGTWLPMTVRRGDATVEVVARFPPRTGR